MKFSGQTQHHIQERGTFFSKSLFSSIHHFSSFISVIYAFCWLLLRITECLFLRVISAIFFLHFPGEKKAYFKHIFNSLRVSHNAFWSYPLISPRSTPTPQLSASSWAYFVKEPLTVQEPSAPCTTEHCWDLLFCRDCGRLLIESSICPLACFRTNTLELLNSE